MADISSIKMPNGSIYDLKDKNAQTKINVFGILEGDGQGGISESDILDYDTDTTSGSVVSFTADGVAPLKSLTLGIDPVQDLHGYDAPWPAGGGKNKFDVDKMVNTSDITISNGVITVTGNSKNSTKKLSELADLTIGEAYILTANTTGSENLIYLYGTGANVSWSFGTSKTITQEMLDALVFFYGGSGTTSQISNMMIRLSSISDATFSPYSNLCPISGWDEANLWRTGKNLWELIPYQSGTSQVRFGSTSADVFPYFLKAGTYTFSSEGEKYYTYVQKQGESTYIIIHNATTLSGEFTLSEDGWYRFWMYAGSADASKVTNVMLELGSTPTPYAPYTGTTATIQLGQTVYGGTLDVTNGVLTVDYRFLNAADVTWRKSGDVVFYAPSDLYTTVSADTPTGRKPLLCNTFSYYSGSSMRDGDIGYGGINNNGNITIRSSVAASTLEDWNDYIANNTVQIVYPLATPLTYTLTPQQLDTLTGQNVVWGDCGPVDVEYRKGENALLQDISEAIKNLQGKIRVSGLLKGDGNGNVTAAINGTDYSKVIIRDWSVT